MKPVYTDQRLIDFMLEGDPVVMIWIYKKYRLFIQHYILLNGGNRQDAQDVYQDVMLALLTNVTSGKLTCLQGKLSTYLYKLTQNLWRSRLRRHEPLRGASTLADYASEPSTDTASEDVLLERLMSILDERCRLILRLYYFDKLPMSTVAIRVGLNSAESARKRKCDCLSRLRELALHVHVETGNVSETESLPAV
ncbi:RNA polymerase sigma factor [Fibrella forsythiae]|uniref:Sigma-70 family RNA polymerase sigma factor n=1 Tax=Fibrella forsythiae TaxID=2817061 RepID=A0ABS3JRJ2_9BACT|nr:sigma-70 family RNA polymerase sigma factor [Fibrella forsythiae]MBO0952627.1 sigma-70 family RNA polymerase sigma factor [Fibrella forsythiae]